LFTSHLVSPHSTLQLHSRQESFYSLILSQRSLSRGIISRKL